MNLSLRARTALGAVFASTALLIFTAPALADPPANDDLADALPIGPTLPVTISGTTVEATAEAGEPAHGSMLEAKHSVWYALDVPTGGDYPDVVKASTCTEFGGFDNVSVYAVTGPGVAGLTEQTAVLSESPCAFTFAPAEGTDYRIAVDHAIDGGEFSLSVAEPAAPPPNDDFADAQEIGPGLPIEGVSGTNLNATAESGEPAHGNTSEAYNSVWYALNVPAAGDYADVVTVDACGEFGGNNNYVGVYEVQGPGFGGLVETEAVGLEQSCAFTFAVTEGTDYRIAVDNLGGGEGFELSVVEPVPPPNDMFEDREPIPSTLPQELDGATVDATPEEFEPEHGPRGPERSVWYEWTTGVDEPVKIDVCETGSEFEFSPEIAAYRSGQEDPAFMDLDRIADNDGRGCTLVFDPADAGTVYIAVDGIRSERDFNLKLAPANPPANDDFADRQTIPATLPQTLPGTTFDASAEYGEPEHDGGPARRSVWYEWTSDATVVKIDVCDADFDQPAISVYVGGPAADDLMEVAGNYREGCTLLLGGLPGGDPITFYIAIDSGIEQEGEFNLTLRVPSPPANDDFEDALEVGPGLPVSVDGTNVDATAEDDEPSGSNASSVWYSWTPAATQTVVAHTCSSSFESTLAVYTGSVLEELNEVSDNEDCPGSSPGDKVVFEATEGTQYLIAVEGDGEGTFTLGIQAPGAAPGMPAVTGVSPASGSDDNDPRIIGTADPGSTVDIYADPICDDGVVGSGTAAEFASPGIPAEVPDNSSTTFYAKAVNVDGGSDCSTTSVTYEEVTPPPAAPTFTGSSPLSGADDNDPELIGTAEPGSTVRIYTDPACAGAVTGQGSAALFAGAGITVHVADNTTTSFYATAQNANGTSPCSSTPLTYQEVTGSTPSSGGGQADPGPTKLKCPKGKVLKKGACVKKKKKKKKKK